MDLYYAFAIGCGGVDNRVITCKDILEGVDELAQLCYVNEASLLHNLRCRYSNDIIYVCINRTLNNRIEHGEEDKGVKPETMGDESDSLSANKAAGKEEEGNTTPFPDRKNHCFSGFLSCPASRIHMTDRFVSGNWGC